MDEMNNNSGLRSEVAVGLAVVGMIFILIVPLPPVLLDVLLAMNIAFAVLVLLITLGVREPLELSTYPTLLLMTTLFRLALNVASTRLILLKGQAGHVIAAFGDFVVGGELVVGITIFIILLIIQFVVITKGSNRISEVAARFTLDAMPGKQMAIDADLNAGLIEENTARTRREAIAQEAEFYGAMDGAGKFVRGDAIAGLIINMINILGGVIIGMSAGLPAGSAFNKYAILTIGDGLVSQTPALIIAVAAGILVTKTSSKRQFASEFTSQIFGNPRALGISAGVLGLAAIIPGFPALPFLVLACGLGLAARKAAVREKEAMLKSDEPAAEPEATGQGVTPEVLDGLLHVDRMGIEVGYRLIKMVDADKSGGLLEHIGMIRKQFASNFGILVPPIRLKDNLSLEANTYRILIAGQEVARGELFPNHHLAMNPGGATADVSGIKSTDPTFGLPAVWIAEDKKTEAEMLGHTVVDCVSVLVTHLTETLKCRAHEILTREDVQALLNRLKETAPTVVDEIVPDVLNLGDIQGVLQNLLSERIPVRNLTAILECLADSGRRTKDVDHLTELVRQRLAPTLCELRCSPDGILRALVFDPGFESEVEQMAVGPDSPGLSPVVAQTIASQIAEHYAASVKNGAEPVVLARATLRKTISELISNLKPKVYVLSYNEAASAERVEPVGQITNTPQPAVEAGVGA